MKSLIQSRGFTLLEMIIIMMLISILSITLVMRWPGERLNISSQAEQLLNDIRYIQALSMNQNKMMMIEFNSNNYQFKTATNIPVSHPLTGESVIHLSQGMMIQVAQSKLLFNYMGVPFVDHSNQPLTSVLNITLLHGQENKQIIINPETGYAQFKN